MYTPYACPNPKSELHWSSMQIIILIFFVSLGLIFIVGMPVVFCVYMKHTKKPDSLAERRIQLVER
jgi:hypothetical protein